MRNAGVILCVLLVAAGTLHAGLGDVEYVPCEPKGTGTLRASPREFGWAGPDSGTVNPNAPVATLKRGSFVVKAAIDSQSPDVKTPDVLRLDFSGKGKFDDEHVVTLKPSGQESQQIGPMTLEIRKFDPVTLEIQRDGQILPVTVEGYYSESRRSRFLALGLGLAVQATCQFGDKTYPVRLINGNSNLRVDDAPRPKKSGGRTVGLTEGDAIAVDLGDGEVRRPVRNAYYGQPIPVNGTWYEVKLSADGKKITTKPLDVKTGQIKIDHDNCSMMLVGEKYWLRVSGGRKAVSVPQDRYTVTGYHEQTPKGRFGYSRPGKAKVFDVVEGKVTALEIGSPLTASVQATQRKTLVTLTLNVLDVAGMPMSYLFVQGRGRPPAPTFKIRDEDGKVVHAGTMRYG